MTVVHPPNTEPSLAPSPASAVRCCSAPSPTSAPPVPPADTGSSWVRVVPWHDPLVDALGVDPRSRYAEYFWLPIIGPTATWFLRRLAARFDNEHGGFDLELDETARALGLGGRRSRHSPFARALGRCVSFELAHWLASDTIRVRRMLPPLAHRHLVRLPPVLQEAHRRWTAISGPPSSLQAQRRRARRLALGLVALGESLDGAESQLLRWGVHPVLSGEAVIWARRLEGADVLPDRS